MKPSEEKALKKIELAQVYYEDGAPKTAERLLLEAQKVLGAKTVSPFLKLCRGEIKRREKFFSAQALGAKGGAVKSKAKAEAARENGKKGGRPRKKKKVSK